MDTVKKINTGGFIEPEEETIMTELPPVQQFQPPPNVYPPGPFLQNTSQPIDEQESHQDRPPQEDSDSDSSSGTSSSSSSSSEEEKKHHSHDRSRNHDHSKRHRGHGKEKYSFF